MTPDEIASFRALLQAQTAPAPAVQRGWMRFGRRRDDVMFAAPRLDGMEAPAAAAASSHGSPALLLQEILADWEAPVAAPPPRSPPRFGRRDDGGNEPQALTLGPALVLDASPPGLIAVGGRTPVWDGEHATPEVPPERQDEAPSSVAAQAPGVIAGWSRVRPPSAQRRILARLEAVFLAEHQGLEARLAAQARAA